MKQNKLVSQMNNNELRDRLLQLGDQTTLKKFAVLDTLLDMGKRPRRNPERLFGIPWDTLQATYGPILDTNKVNVLNDITTQWFDFTNFVNKVKFENYEKDWVMQYKMITK